MNILLNQHFAAIFLYAAISLGKNILMFLLVIIIMIVIIKLSPYAIKCEIFFLSDWKLRSQVIIEIARRIDNENESILENNV